MVYGSELQRGGIKNPKLDEQADENVDTVTYSGGKKAGLHNGLANKTTLLSSTTNYTSTKKLTTVLGESKRPILTDKSNRSGQKQLSKSLSNKDINQTQRLQELEYVLLPNTQVESTLPSHKKVQESITTTIDKNNNKHDVLSSKQPNIMPASTSSSTHINNNKKDKVKPNEEQKQQQQEEEETNEDVKAFFEDNKQRYNNKSKDDKPKMDPTPILPIIVPDRIKPYVRERYLSSSSIAAASSIKRSYEGIYQRGEHLLSNLKKQKSKHQHDLDPHPHQGIDTSEKENIDPNQIGKPIKSSSSSSISPSTTNPLNKHNININTNNTNNNNNNNNNNNSNTNSHSHHSTQQQQHSSSSKPAFHKLQTDDYQPTEINVDEETYNQVNESEKEQEKRSQSNILQFSITGREVDDEDELLKDPMLVSEYADDIHTYLRSMEKNVLADPNYIKDQHEITWRMRSVLVDWVIEVHYIFQLLPETLFLTINIIDRFLSKRDVSLCKLQLVGITSLFIATKFEETASPTIKQYLYMTGDTITEDDLLKAERFILQVLDFRLCYPNPLQFLRRCAMIGNFDLHIRMLAKYFMEISCVDYRFISVPPSKTAAAALWLSTKMLCKGTWSPELVRISGYTIQDIKPIVELMLDYLSQNVRDEAFHKKWSTKRMMRISTFVHDWVHKFYQ